MLIFKCSKTRRAQSIPAVTKHALSLRAPPSHPLPSLDMAEHEVERPRHSVEIQGLDEQCRRFDLSPPVPAEKTAEPRLSRAFSPRRLILKYSERFQPSLRVADPFHSGGTQRANQLVLQVCDADVETESFHVGAS